MFAASDLPRAGVLREIPPPSDQRIALRVTPDAERALRQGHPWLFDQAIQHQSHAGAPGDLAVIFDHKRSFLAIGLYDPASPIRVRILQHRSPAAINQEWFIDRLGAAVNLRSSLAEGGAGAPKTTGYRLVHGENDGLPGLVVDRYEGTLVIKMYTTAWVPHLPDIIESLFQIFPPGHPFSLERLVLRLGRGAAESPNHLYGLQNGDVLAGAALDGAVMFWENGLRFEADVVAGQKTGFFFDQRDNRARLAELLALRHRIRSQRVLNLFAYTGGFSVYAAQGWRDEEIEVTSVDISAPAVAATIRNLAHNGFLSGNGGFIHRGVTQDAFAFLAEEGAQGSLYDVVVIDPPSFANKQSQVPGALAAYARLAAGGLRILRPGGLLVMASCSSRIDSESFFEVVHRGAAQSGRRISGIARTGHALDHPIGFKEGAYLKCLFANAG